MANEDLHFSLIDYGIFGGMLAISAIIGLYFGFFGKRKQNNPVEYLLGSKSMKVFPVAVSLTATHVSAVTVLGVPAEMYRYGIQYWACAISGLIITILTAHFYLPVFYDLQITSSYTYLEKRFGQSLCSLGSGLFTLFVVLVLPLLVYAPALAFSQVTGVNLHVITPIMCVICIFYTTLGGLRAVVWTDTLQFISMIAAIAAVMYLGTDKVDGVTEIVKANERGGRMILFDMDTDPFIRSSFWTITIGLTTLWISNIGITPECIQRYLSVPTLLDAQKVCWIFGIGHILIKLCSVYNGMLIYTMYETCDPVHNGKVEKADQIFAYFVMDICQKIPGLPGLFVAGVFSAALSSMSSCLNTLAGTIYMDFFRPRFPNTSELTASKIMKGLVVLVGMTCLGMVFLVEKLGNIFSLGITIGGITSGALLGLFTLGMIYPRANKTGALWGAYSSLIIISVIAFGAQYHIANGNLRYQSLPFRTDGCSASNSTLIYTLNESSIHIDNLGHDNSQVFWLFRISFIYYALLGTILVMVVGIPVSYFTSSEEDVKSLDLKLLTPLARRFVKKHNSKSNTDTELKQLNHS